jgi:hypothetical protein
MARRTAPRPLSSMTGGIIRDDPLSWRQVAAVAEGAAREMRG